MSNIDKVCVYIGAVFGCLANLMLGPIGPINQWAYDSLGATYCCVALALTITWCLYSAWEAYRQHKSDMLWRSVGIDPKMFKISLSHLKK